jgi:glycosyltransferase involved in cell wall biosynthesis
LTQEQQWSVDTQAWNHPFLTTRNIARFRDYSDQVLDVATRHAAASPRPMSCAFTVNMAQNMYKWACLTQARGWRSVLIPTPLDKTAISQPEWEEFDGEFPDLLAGEDFLREHPGLALRAPVLHAPLDGVPLAVAQQAFDNGDRRPLLSLVARSPGLRDVELMTFPGVYPFYSWAAMLAEYNVVYAASAPIAAYMSGAPYCAFSVGGDLEYDCGRPDTHGELMVRAFNAARFLLASNPHTLGHSRRLGLTNATYMPYPMDTHRYAPGPGLARERWNAQFGDGVYVLTTARLDSAVKGHDGSFYDTIVSACRQHPSLRFVFLQWGANAEAARERIAAEGLEGQMLMMKPVGKTRLIDYYRSCDVVLDQFVYGYYGATALEAASVGKPVIMKLRRDHYDPLYRGDVAPVMNVAAPQDMLQALHRLVEDPDFRRQAGAAMRDWIVRTHGEDTATPKMMALLQLAADRVALPPDLVSPLRDELTEEEAAYHAARWRPWG